MGRGTDLGGVSEAGYGPVLDVRTTKAHFQVFRDTFTDCQHRFGLTEWRVDFVHVPLDGLFAQLEGDHHGMVATVRFNVEIPDWAADCFDPVVHGKHEAIHLLISEMHYLAKRRDVQDCDIEAADERIVRRLEKLL